MTDKTGAGSIATIMICCRFFMLMKVKTLYNTDRCYCKEQ